MFISLLKLRKVIKSSFELVLSKWFHSKYIIYIKNKNMGKLLNGLVIPEWLSVIIGNKDFTAIRSGAEELLIDLLIENEKRA